MPARLFPKGKLSAPLPSLKAYKALSFFLLLATSDKALVLSLEPTGAALASVAVNPGWGVKTKNAYVPMSGKKALLSTKVVYLVSLLDRRRPGAGR